MTDGTDDDDGIAPVREGDLVADKYLVGKCLGKGGMGVVVAARDKVLGRKVAIKFLRPRLACSEHAVLRFVREARVATRITSEHVVTLLEIGTLPSGIPFFVMEYLEGRDLRRFLSDEGPLSSVDAVDYLLQALEALAEGHRRGIVHRDIKPANLFLTRRADGTPLVKVLDFGIAKVLEVDDAQDPSITGSQDIRLGSPPYMSPEQLLGPHEVDVRTDVWALGVTLYELISGKLPFQGGTPAEFALKIAKGSPDSPSRGRPDLALPHGLVEVVLRCLEREKASRYTGALELAEALVRFGGPDSRVSLKRIRGLFSERPSTDPADASPVPEALDPTLEAPVSSTARAPLSSPVPQLISRPPPQHGNRALLIWLAVLGVAAAIGFYRLEKPASSAPPVPRVVAPAGTQASRPSQPSPAQRAHPPAQPATIATQGKLAGASMSASTPARTVARETELVKTVSTRREISTAEAQPSPASPSASVAAAASSAPSPNERSPHIEQLIQHRR